MTKRISKKACNEIAGTIGAMFYGRNEWDCSGKVYVKYNGKLHTFKRNRDALDFMLDIIVGEVNELAEQLDF